MYLSSTLHSAVPQPQRLLQQLYTESIEVTLRASDHTAVCDDCNFLL